jgi:hypothetical protein
MQHIHNTTQLPPDPAQHRQQDSSSHTSLRHDENANHAALPAIGSIGPLPGILAVAGVALGGIGLLVHSIWQQANHKKEYVFELDRQPWKETNVVCLQMANAPAVSLSLPSQPAIVHVFTFFKSNVTFVGYTPSVHQRWTNSVRVNLMAVEDDCVLLFSVDPRDQRNYVKDGLYIFKMDTFQCLLIHLDRGHFSGALIDSSNLDSVQRCAGALLPPQSTSMEEKPQVAAAASVHQTGLDASSLVVEPTSLRHIDVADSRAPVTSAATVGLSASSLASDDKMLSLSQRKFRRYRA